MASQRANDFPVNYYSQYLALVGPVVPFLNVLDLKGPIVRALRMQHLKPLVVRVREHRAGQDVEVTPSYPGYLKQEARRSSISLLALGPRPVAVGVINRGFLRRARFRVSRPGCRGR